jgi:hypothetical protein
MLLPCKSISELGSKLDASLGLAVPASRGVAARFRNIQTILACSFLLLYIQGKEDQKLPGNWTHTLIIFFLNVTLHSSYLCV